MRSRCPHCQEAVDVPETDPLAEIHCSTCGGNFSLASAKTTIYGAGAAEVIGHFELLEELGHGAFGRVWKARDQDLDRLVAVKIPHRAPLNEDEAERFLREARAAAQLRHPGIVNVHEVSREDDTVYIVCDFIQGATLNDWVQGKGLTVFESVDLVVEIAEALEHAHQHGVVHRDLKPANILIDGGRKPHIADFGMAKRDAADVTMTVDGQLVGTPAYMPPEQARGEGHHVDGRSDVYSLGVILFQLLTGELPFRGSARMITVQILNDEPPNLRKLKASVPRDLDTITLKCLEKDADRRYQTAAELAEDLKRWRAGEPIKARPISRTERLWRWCRRNPAVATLSAGVLALLLVVAVGSVSYSVRLRQYARREHAARTEAETYFRMTLQAVDEMLTEVGEESLANIPHMEPVRKALLQRALRLHQRLLEFKPSAPGLRLELARSQHRMGNIYELLGQHQQARRAYEQAISMLEQLQSEQPDNLQVRHHLAISHGFLGELFRKTSAQQADSCYRKALRLQEELHRMAPENVEFHRELSRTWNNRGLLLTETGRFDEAEEALTKAIDMLGQLTAGSDPPPDFLADLARSYINLGVLLKKQPGRASESERPYRDAIGVLERLVTTHGENREYRYKLAVARLDLANMLLYQNHEEPEIRTLLDRAVESLQALHGNFPGIPRYCLQLANSYNSLAATSGMSGKWKEAGKSYRLAGQCLDELHTHFPEYTDNVGKYHNLRGRVCGGIGALALLADNDPARARTLVQEAIRHQRRALELSPGAEEFQKCLREHQGFLEVIHRKTESGARPESPEDSDGKGDDEAPEESDAGNRTDRQRANQSD